MLLLMLLSMGLAAPAQQSKQQLQKEKTRIEAEIRKLDAELAKAKKNSRLTATQLKALQKKIDERNRLIGNINNQLSILESQIAHTQDSLNTLSTRVDSLKREYAAVIRTLYRERQHMDKLSLLYDTPNYNRTYLRYKYYNAYSRYRRHQAAYIKTQQQELEDITLKLQQQQNEQHNLLAQEQRQREQLARERTQQQQSLSTSQAKEQRLASQLAKKQEQKRKLESQIQKLVAEEVAKAKRQQRSANSGKTMTSTVASSNTEVALSSDFSKNKGKLSWPVYYRSITREFGKYRHESGGENMSNGIDFTTAPNAAVYCIFKGTVSRIFTCPNGTKGVIVRHGEYMTVYANMATVSVKEGATVATKQAIGTVYTTKGNDNGEFSFQIWQGTTPNNPRTWLR